MSSFKDGLRRSGQSVLDARAQNLYEMTKIEEERFIQECKMKVLRIKNELNKHRDLSVKSTTSLEVGNGFDPKAWVAKRHQLERDLRVANIEYALALKVDGEEFPADETEEQANLAVITSKTKSLEAIQRTVQITEEGRAAAERAKWEQEKEKAIAVTKAQQEFEVAELEAKKAKQVALKVQAEGEAKAAANRALVAAGLTPAERAEWDYKTAVGVAQALAESKVSWVPSVMFGGGSSSNSAMDAVGLKMLLDITKSLDKTSK